MKNIRSDDSLKAEVYDLFKIGLKVVRGALNDGWEQDIQFNTEIVVKHLTSEFGYLQISEVKKAVSEGWFGKWGEFHGVTPKSFMFFIRRYAASYDRKMLKESTVKKLPPTKAGKIDYQKTWDQARKKFKETGTILGVDFIYRVGLKMKKIDVNDDDMRELAISNAIDEINSEVQGAYHNGNMTKVRKLKKSIKEKDYLYQSRCKEEVLKILFK